MGTIEPRFRGIVVSLQLFFPLQHESFGGAYFVGHLPITRIVAPTDPVCRRTRLVEALGEKLALLRAAQFRGRFDFNCHVLISLNRGAETLSFTIDRNPPPVVPTLLPVVSIAINPAVLDRCTTPASYWGGGQDLNLRLPSVLFSANIVPNANAVLVNPKLPSIGAYLGGLRFTITNAIATNSLPVEQGTEDNRQQLVGNCLLLYLGLVRAHARLLHLDNQLINVLDGLGLLCRRALA